VAQFGDGTVALQVFRQSGADHTLIAEDQRTVGGNLTEFEVRIPVSGADQIGLKVPGVAMVPGCVFQTANAGDIIGVVANGPVGTTVPLSGSDGYRFNVSADVEPDADNDDYGDETQDLCPADVSTQADCSPPETEITKGAPNRLDRSTFKFKFTSDEPGSTFECKIDKKPYKPCTSPRKVRRLDEGKHKFKVVATDEAGNTDPSAAKDRFKVVD